MRMLTYLHDRMTAFLFRVICNGVKINKKP